MGEVALAEANGDRDRNQDEGEEDNNNVSAISKRVVDSAVSDALADIGRMNSSSATAASEDPRDVSQLRAAPEAAESSIDEAGIAESSDAPAVLQNSMTI